MRGIRRVTGEEIKKDTADVMFDILNETQKLIPYTHYYSKFRAYLFINSGVFALLCFLISAKCFLSGDSENFPLGGFSLLAIVPFILICRWLWKGVEKKVLEKEKRLVFWGFFSTGVLTLAKLVLCTAVITIPLVFFIGGEYGYTYRMVEDGENAGEVVLMRYKLNGQLEDIYGRVYKDEI